MHRWRTECGPAASVRAARMVHSVSKYLAPLVPMLSSWVLVGIHYSFFVGTCRATVLFPMCVGDSVLFPRALKSEDENRRRHPEIAQRLERQVRSNIPTRMMGGFCTLEGLRMTAAKTGVRRHDSRRQRARFNRYRAVAPFSIIRERLGASRLPSLRSALRGLDPPGALPGDQLLPERRPF
jgi:hypothetical protein